MKNSCQVLAFFFSKHENPVILGFGPARDRKLLVWSILAHRYRWKSEVQIFLHVLGLWAPLLLAYSARGQEKKPLFFHVRSWSKLIDQGTIFPVYQPELVTRVESRKTCYLWNSARNRAMNSTLGRLCAVGSVSALWRTISHIESSSRQLSPFFSPRWWSAFASWSSERRENLCHRLCIRNMSVMLFHNKVSVGSLFFIVSSPGPIFFLMSKGNVHFLSVMNNE